MDGQNNGELAASARLGLDEDLAIMPGNHLIADR
jgi:hypothetical protein